MVFKIFKNFVLAATAALTFLSTYLILNISLAEEKQYFPIESSRVGPYSAMGTGYYGAQIDYMNYVNMNGGVNGVMLTWQECETEYNAVKTVECYQRLLEKDGQRIVVFDTLGTPGAYAVINRMAEDNVVLAQYGYGRTDGADGRVWPWVFNAASHYWSQIAVKMKFMAEKEGGIDKMKGKKGETKKVYKFNDGFGNDIIYEFTKSSWKPKAFAINWFLKYILISQPDDIQKYVLELQKIQKQPNRLIKSKEILEGELNKILVRIFIKQWESIKWDKEKTGRSMFQGWGDSFTKLWKLHLSKNTQSKPSNNNKAPQLHFSTYRNHIGKGEYNRILLLSKLKELNTLSKKANPLF